MFKIFVLSDRPHFRILLSESLWFEGHMVEGVNDAAALWELLKNTRPDLILLDAGSDEFGTMELFQDLKEQIPGLDIIVCECLDYSDVERIKGG